MHLTKSWPYLLYLAIPGVCVYKVSLNNQREGKMYSRHFCLNYLFKAATKNTFYKIEMKGRKAVSKNTMIHPHYAKGTKKAKPSFSKMNIYVVMWKKCPQCKHRMEQVLKCTPVE